VGQLMSILAVDRAQARQLLLAAGCSSVQAAVAMHFEGHGRHSAGAAQLPSHSSSADAARNDASSSSSSGGGGGGGGGSSTTIGRGRHSSSPPNAGKRRRSDPNTKRGAGRGTAGSRGGQRSIAAFFQPSAKKLQKRPHAAADDDDDADGADHGAGGGRRPPRPAGLGSTPRHRATAAAAPLRAPSPSSSAWPSSGRGLAPTESGREAGTLKLTATADGSSAHPAAAASASGQVLEAPQNARCAPRRWVIYARALGRRA
jgi:hypothetical protein